MAEDAAPSPAVDGVPDWCVDCVIPEEPVGSIPEEPVGAIPEEPVGVIPEDVVESLPSLVAAGAPDLSGLSTPTLVLVGDAEVMAGGAPVGCVLDNAHEGAQNWSAL